MYLYMTPLFFMMVSLSLGAIRRFLMVSPPFRCTCTPCLLHVLLKFSLRPWWYGTTICGWLMLGCSGLVGFNRTEQPNINQPHIVVPYHQGLSENFKRTCSKHGVQVHLKGGLTIKNLLMVPKDKDTIMKKSGVIYRYMCNRVECDEEYIGESAGNFEGRFKEHL